MQENIKIAGQEFTYSDLQEKFNIPDNCKIDGCNLVPLEASSQIEYLRFKHFIAMFPLDGFAGKTADKLSDIDELFDNPINLFNPEVVNIESLKSVGFGPSQAPSFIAELEKWKTKGIPLYRFIKALGIDGCGNTISKEFSKKISGVDFSTSGLTKEIWSELESRESEIWEMVTFVQTFGYIVNFDEVIIKTEPSADSKSYVLTGSPKEHGFKTKAEFQALVLNWSEAKKIKDADFLITDDVASSSSKTKEANKLGKQIITYTEAINIYNS